MRKATQFNAVVPFTFSSNIPHAMRFSDRIDPYIRPDRGLLSAGQVWPVRRFQVTRQIFRGKLMRRSCSSTTAAGMRRACSLSLPPCRLPAFEWASERGHGPLGGVATRFFAGRSPSLTSRSAAVAWVGATPPSCKNGWVHFRGACFLAPSIVSFSYYAGRCCYLCAVLF